jgi:hypothetical protein
MGVHTVRELTMFYKCKWKSMHGHYHFAKEKGDGIFKDQKENLKLGHR